MCCDFIFSSLVDRVGGSEDILHSGHHRTEPLSNSSLEECEKTQTAYSFFQNLILRFVRLTSYSIINSFILFPWVLVLNICTLPNNKYSRMSSFIDHYGELSFIIYVFGTLEIVHQWQ